MSGQDSEQGQQEHTATLPTQVSPTAFERVLLAAVGRHRKAMVTLFGGRISYWTIRDWRRGKVGPPWWAWTILAIELEARAARDLEFAAIARNPPSVAPGQGSHRNICKWNQRRFAESGKTAK